MHVHRRHHRPSFAIRVALVAALLGVCFGGLAAVAGAKPNPKGVKGPKPKIVKKSQLPGKWTGQYSGIVSGTFVIHWKLKLGILTGSIKLSKPKGSYSIGGKVVGSTITFGAVGVGAKYTGTVSGTSMAGTWTAPGASGTWTAHKG